MPSAGVEQVWEAVDNAGKRPQGVCTPGEYVHIGSACLEHLGGFKTRPCVEFTAQPFALSGTWFW